MSQDEEATHGVETQHPDDVTFEVRDLATRDRSALVLDAETVHELVTADELAACQTEQDIHDLARRVVQHAASEADYRGGEILCPGGEPIDINLKPIGRAGLLQRQIIEFTPWFAVRRDEIRSKEAKRREEQLLVAQREAERQRKEVELGLQIERDRFMAGNLLDILDPPAVHEDAEWMIPDMLHVEDFVTFTGEPGTGKSTAIFQIGYAAAVGIHPATHEEMPKRRFLYIDLQNTAEHTRSNVRLMPVKPDGAAIRVEHKRAFHIEDEDVQDELIRIITDWQPDIVAIGPFTEMSPHEISRGHLSESVSRALRATIDKARKEHPFAVLLEAHHGRSKTDHKPYGSVYLTQTTTKGVWLSRNGESKTWRHERDALRPWPIMRRQHDAIHGWPWDLSFENRAGKTQRDMFNEFVAKNPTASIRTISEYTGIPKTTVANWKKQLPK